MKVSLYARVSTTDKGQDPELQLRELRDYCQGQISHQKIRATSRSQRAIR